ncbi:hypothetical protein ACTXT7_013821 [Hymenolepis weldensis]
MPVRFDYCLDDFIMSRGRDKTFKMLEKCKGFYYSLIDLERVRTRNDSSSNATYNIYRTVYHKADNKEGEKEIDIPLSFTKSFKFTVSLNFSENIISKCLIPFSISQHRECATKALRVWPDVEVLLQQSKQMRKQGHEYKAFYDQACNSVDKPFNFKQTQHPTSGSEIYVDAEIENLTPQALMIERIAFEPGPMLKVTDMNNVVDWVRNKQEGRPTSGFMAPRDIWRLLYRTQPLNPSKSPSNSSNEGEVLGHMDIAWRSAMGETGRLLTQDYKVEPHHYNEISMKVIELPTQVTVENPFKLVCEISNRSTRVLEPLLTRPDSEMNTSSNASELDASIVAASASSAFIWTGMTNQLLEKLAPGASLRLTLEYVPVMTGLQVRQPSFRSF